MSTTIDQLRAEDFSALQEQPVTLRSGDVEIECRIDTVRALPPHPFRAQPPFAVTLRGPCTPLLPQGMAALGHPVHGVLEVFIVPTGPCGEGFGYELTFN